MPDKGPTSLDSMLFEIEGQVEGLNEYSKYLRANWNSNNATPEQLIFAGSGDSYSAGLWTQELSHGKSLAYDPFELALKPSWAKDKHLFIISVSGKTRANLFLASRVKGIASKRIAVTSEPESELAKECDQTIRLAYNRGRKLTSGTASYTASLFACTQILGEMPAELHLDHSFHPLSITERLLEKSSSFPEFKNTAKKEQLKRQKLSTRDGLVLFVGTGIDYPLAYYAALKFNEVLGLKAFPSYPEQVGHSLLFSLDPEKDRIVMLDPTSNRRLREVNETLSSAGFSIYEMTVPPQNPLSRTLELALDIQMLAYNMARDQGMKECAFMSDKRRLETSNSLIY